jgi:hypothetical protein
MKVTELDILKVKEMGETNEKFMELVMKSIRKSKYIDLPDVIMIMMVLVVYSAKGIKGLGSNRNEFLKYAEWVYKKAPGDNLLDNNKDLPDATIH